MSELSLDEPIGILRYFGDPMCSWCWGFKPVLEQVELEYPELKRITVMGGLRGEGDSPMSDELMKLIQSGWMRIEETTGQPFNHEFWQQHRPLATTLPACKAVLTARAIDPDLEWPFMVGMFKAYFTQAMDPTDNGTHLSVAKSLGFDIARFKTFLHSGEVDEALEKDLSVTRRFGVTGFPTVVLTIGTSNYLVSPGYQPIEGLRRAINAAYQDAGIEFTRPESGIYS